jgi:hypothetical protein
VYQTGSSLFPSPPAAQATAQNPADCPWQPTQQNHNDNDVKILSYCFQYQKYGTNMHYAIVVIAP